MAGVLEVGALLQEGLAAVAGGEGDDVHELLALAAVVAVPGAEGDGGLELGLPKGAAQGEGEQREHPLRQLHVLFQGDWGRQARCGSQGEADSDQHGCS